MSSGEKVRSLYGIEGSKKPGTGSSNGGNMGGMDRFEHLEKRVDEIDSRLGRIEGDVSTLKADVGDIRTTLAKLEGGLSANVEALRADIHKSISENNKWTHTATVGMFSAFVLGVLGLLFTIWNASKSQVGTAAPQQPPIILTLPSSLPATPAVTPAAPPPVTAPNPSPENSQP